MTTIRLGSRKSRLALWQTERIARMIRDAHPGVQTEIVTMDTTGDKIRDRPMPKIGVKGLFTKELEEALLADEVDIAVHSLKDLPTSLPPGLKYAGSPGRAAPTDALISPKWSGVSELPDGAVIATGSVRRRAQLAAANATFEFRELRGNIDTRLRKLEENGWDAIIMATAALHRLERPELVSEELDVDHFVPAVGQGAIGLETREGRDDVDAIVAPLLDHEVVTAVTAERLFMKRLEGGCSVSLGAYCRRDSDHWSFRGWVSSTDGTKVILDATNGADPLALAESMVDDFVARGARDVLGR
jgi:hydroxymethylbilane synthase